MKIKLYRSSTVGIDLGDYKILTDPWLTDGEYYGSWSHYPYFDLDSNLEELNSHKAIYISHIHPDHCSENTLSRLDKNIPVFIHKFHSPFLKSKIQKIGFNNIVELENGVKTKLAKDCSITIYAADNCDPELCYKFTGCANLSIKGVSQQIDTISVIENKSNTIVNVNDCPYELAEDTLEIIKNNFKNIDILLTGYGGAGPYPQCFDNLNYEEKIIEAKKKKINFLNQALAFIEFLNPKYYLPFAGTYTLAGKLSNKQNIRGVPSLKETYNYLDENLKLKKKNKNISAIKIGPEQVFDFDNINDTSKYTDINAQDQQNYIDNVLSHKKFNYEEDSYPEKEEILNLSIKAYKNFLEKKNIYNSKINSDVVINCRDFSILLPYDKNDIEIKEINFSPNRKFLRLTLDVRLLKRILKGPKYAHWNNAEIGSHISYYRYPNIFDRNLHLSLCYFHS
jgi:UDP-MurNAc hydroxylase